jgi:cytoskeleton protein RodZ
MTDQSMGKLETSQPEGAYVPVDAVFSDAPIGVRSLLGIGLGERLRHARTSAGLTLDSAAARTRIKRDFLDALETMDPRGLPSRAYAVGYLRTYANFLGLDAAACIDQFKAEVEVRRRPRHADRAPGKTGDQAAARHGRCDLDPGRRSGGAGWYGNYLSQSQALRASTRLRPRCVNDPAPLVAAERLGPPRTEAIWSALPAAVSAGALDPGGGRAGRDRGARRLGPHPVRPRAGCRRCLSRAGRAGPDGVGV